MKTVKVVVEKDGKIPSKATEGSACYDLYSPSSFVLAPEASIKVPLNVMIELPRGTAAILSHRSGLHSNNNIVAYGIIDEDYRGILCVTLNNIGFHQLYVKKGDRIAQMRIVDVPETVLIQVPELEKSERGGGGHGSTGV